MAGRASGGSESAASLIFGGGGGGGGGGCGGGGCEGITSSRRQRRPEPLAANVMLPNERHRAEMDGDRWQRKPAMSSRDMYGDYMAHVEDHAINKMRQTFGRLEARADREHEMMSGAAGCTSEERARMKYREPSSKRGASPQRQREQGDPDSVAGLIAGQHERPGRQPRPESPGRRRQASPRRERPPWQH